MGWFGKKSNEEMHINIKINEIIAALEQKKVYRKDNFQQLCYDGGAVQGGGVIDEVEVSMLYVLGLIDYLKKLALLAHSIHKKKRTYTAVEELVDRSEVMRAALNIPSELFNVDGQISGELSLAMGSARKIRMPIENVIMDLKEIQKD